jgi:uncharacterized Zn finger protein
MRCTECGNQGKIVRRGMTFMGDIFRCSCRQIFTREQSIMTGEAKLDAILSEIEASEESNQNQEIELEPDDNDYCGHELIGDFYRDNPIQNGWVGTDGLP